MGMPCRSLPRTRCRAFAFPLCPSCPARSGRSRSRRGDLIALVRASSPRALEPHMCLHVEDNRQEGFPDCQPGRGPMVAILPVRLTPRSTERGPGVAVPVPSVNAATFHMQNQRRKAGRHRGMELPFLWRCHNTILHGGGLGKTKNGASSPPHLTKKKRGRTIRECGFPTSLQISTYFGTRQRSLPPCSCLRRLARNLQGRFRAGDVLVRGRQEQTRLSPIS
jgi:hypothetical protein